MIFIFITMKKWKCHNNYQQSPLSSSTATSHKLKVLRDPCRAFTHISAWLSGSSNKGQQCRRLWQLTRIRSAFCCAWRSVGRLRIRQSLSSSKSDKISWEICAKTLLYLLEVWCALFTKRHIKKILTFIQYLFTSHLDGVVGAGG